MRPQYSIVTAPATEPITYAQAAEHLRVDSTDDQDYIEALIPVAREFVDSVTGRSSIQAEWLLTADSWESLSPDKWHCNPSIPLFRSPLVSVESVSYYATDAETLTVMVLDTDYRVITNGEPGMIQLIDTIPSVDDRPDAIQIAFTAGYATAADTPAILKHAIKMMVAHFYEQRVPVAFASSSQIPFTLSALIENQKIGGWSA